MNSEEASAITTVFTAGSAVGITGGSTVATVLMAGLTVLSWVFFGGMAINDGRGRGRRSTVGGSIFGRAWH